VAATALDTSRHQIGHRFPRFLADGKHFFFASTPVIEREHEIFLTELGKMTSRFVLRSDATPAYSEDGWLIFRKNLMLNAQRFDVRAGRLTGSPRPLIEGEQFSGVQASPTAWLASNGLMITLPRVPPDEVLAMVTREGRIEPVAGVPIGGWVWPRISPDGRRIVASRYVEQGSSSSGMSLWLVDAARGLSTRLTLGTSVDLSPSWSPDGRWIVYASNRDGAYALYRRSVSGGGDEFITRSSGLVFRAADWTPDGKYFVCESSDPRTGDDVDLTEADPPYAIRPLLHGEYDERAPRVSPDGRWIAYTSTESGRPEVYVDAFPGLGAKVQVSTAGGGDPQWTKNGAELFFEGLDRGIYVSRVTRAPELQVGPPMRLFNFGRSNNGWTVTADGQHLLMALAGDNSLNWAPRVIVNWHGLLAKGK
jgi:dipeptidyl aminopeptidase/acylaminoacyl peptidase